MMQRTPSLPQTPVLSRSPSIPRSPPPMTGSPSSPGNADREPFTDDKVGRCPRCNRAVGFAFMGNSVLCAMCVRHKSFSFGRENSTYDKSFIAEMVQLREKGAQSVPLLKPTWEAPHGGNSSFMPTASFVQRSYSHKSPSPSSYRTSPVSVGRQSDAAPNFARNSNSRSPSRLPKMSRVRDSTTDTVVTCVKAADDVWGAQRVPYDNFRNPFQQFGKQATSAHLHNETLRISMASPSAKAHKTRDKIDETLLLESSVEVATEGDSPSGTKKPRIDPVMFNFFKEMSTRKTKTQPFTMENFTILKDGFCALDVDGEGSLNLRQIARLGEMCFPSAFPTKRLKAADVDKSGSLEFAEIVKVAYPSTPFRELQRLIEDFERAYVPKYKLILPAVERVRARFAPELIRNEDGTVHKSFRKMDEYFNALTSELQKDHEREREEEKRTRPDLFPGSLTSVAKRFSMKQGQSYAEDDDEEYGDFDFPKQKSVYIRRDEEEQDESASKQQQNMVTAAATVLLRKGTSASYSQAKKRAKKIIQLIHSFVGIRDRQARDIQKAEDLPSLKHTIQPTHILQEDFLSLTEGYAAFDLDSQGLACQDQFQEIGQFYAKEKWEREYDFCEAIRPYKAYPFTTFNMQALFSAAYYTLESQNIIDQASKLISSLSSCPVDGALLLRQLKSWCILERLNKKYTPTIVNEIAQMYHMYDVDGSEEISLEEFTELMRKHYSEAEIVRTFEEHDTNCDGVLDLEEWVELLKYSYPPYSKVINKDDYADMPEDA